MTCVFAADIGLRSTDNRVGRNDFAITKRSTEMPFFLPDFLETRDFMLNEPFLRGLIADDSHLKEKNRGGSLASSTGAGLNCGG